MTQIDQAWGAGPSARYETLAARFRPIFQQIAQGAVERDIERTLPHGELAALKQARFTALRLPEEKGGFGATLPELINLLIELSEADSNLTQALRAHFGFTEDVLNSTDAGHRERWLTRIGAGQTAGSAWSEVGEARQANFGTLVRRTEDGLRVTGAKFYTTGSLFADWVDIGAEDEDGNRWSAVVARDAPGVEVIDDWDGFGQTLTASGSAVFTDVPVEPEHLVDADGRFRYSPAFYQLYHLATLAGIGRALSGQVAAAVRDRRRSYSNAPADRPAADPQVLQVVGRIRSAAYSAGAIVLKAAEGLQRAYEARGADEAAADAAIAVSELEVAQAQTPVSNLILDAATVAFDALGASATRRGAGLDRFWRNARTLSSHNPRIYKDRIVGDYAVNGTPPPPQWRIGIV